MADLVWMFREPTCASTPALQGLTIKTDLRGLRTRLETLAGARVAVHYPRPWNLDAFGVDVLGDWIEFHLDVLTLRAEFGDRVLLRPLPFEPPVDNAAPEPILTWLMELSSPDACSVLEALEMVAHLDGQTPWIRGRHLRLSPDLASQLRLFIDRAGLYQAQSDRCNALEHRLEEQQRLAQQERAELECEHESAMAAQQASFRQQAQARDDKYQADLLRMQQAFADDQAALLSQLHDVQERLLAEHTQREAAEQTLVQQRDEIASLTHRGEMLTEEVSVLTEQLHDIQAALQRQQNEAEQLRDELRLAGNTMQWASRLLLSKMRSAG